MKDLMIKLRDYTHLDRTGFHGGLEPLKVETRLINWLII
jgi:hypothetical protein